MNHLVPTVVISLLLLTAVAAASPEPGDTPPPPPTMSVTLAGDSIGDGDTPLIALQSGQTGKKVKLTATAPSPTHIILDAQSFPTNIQGVRFTGGTCLASPTCTIEIVIDSDKADVNAPDFPNNQVGALPGTATHQLTVRSSAGDSLVVPFTLKVKSGEIRVSAFFDGKRISSGSRIDIKSPDMKDLVFNLRGFPADDALPSSLEVSFDLKDPVAGVTTLTSPGSCPKDKLQTDCTITASIIITEEKTGVIPAALASGTRTLFPVDINIISKGIIITAFPPFGFNKDGMLVAYCRAKALSSISPLPQGAVPTFVMDFYDGISGGQQMHEEVTGQPLPGGEFGAAAVLVADHYTSKTLQATCTASLTVNGIEHKDSYSIERQRSDTVSFSEEPGNIQCLGNVDTASLEKVGLSVNDIRLVLTLTDDKGKPLEKDGKILFQKKLAKASTISYITIFGDFPYMIPLDKPLGCLLEVEALHKKTASSVPLVFRTTKTITFGQRCLEIPDQAFTGLTELVFVGVGERAGDYQKVRNNVIAALKEDPVFGIHDLNNNYIFLKAFRLRYVKYPRLENPVGADKLAILADLDKKAEPLHKFCPLLPGSSSQLFVHLGLGGDMVFSGHALYGVETALGIRPIETDLDIKKEQYAIVVHEFGHLLGGLDDEYDVPAVYTNKVYKQPDSNCLPTSTTTVGGRLTCPEWKYYPAFATCLPTCTDNKHFRSTDNSIMRNNLDNQNFNVVQCAYLTEELKKWRDRSLEIDFDRGMTHCIEKRDAYKLVLPPQ